MKICHMTSVHPEEDIRIFHKECMSLTEAGYEVFLVERGESYAKMGVHIVGIGAVPASRFKRMIKTARQAYKKALELDCDVYHLHDPELLPYGLKLKKAGKKVFFDSHEDVPKQIGNKQWMPKTLHPAVSSLYRKYETMVVKQLDAVVAATPHIAEQFEGRAKKVVVINNFPKLDDITFQTRPFEKRERVICYAGSVGELSGMKVMVKAMEHLEGELIIAGNHEVQEIREGSGKVKYIGQLSRAGVNDLYGNSRVGIVVYQPSGNAYDAQPNKMFEFMAAGLPVVASNFPLWKKFIEGNGCGICVDPADVSQVREACRALLDDPERAQAMGRRGREAVLAKYNWDLERGKLIELYESL